MSVYRAILNILENDSTFVTAIGTDDDSNIKVYTIFPTKEVPEPFVAMKINNQAGNPTKDEASAVDNVSFQVRVFDYNMDTVISISEKLRTALDKKSGTYDTVSIADIDFDGFSDDFLFFEGKRPLLFRELNFEIWIEP